jgi:hypothetical protein
MQDYSFQISFRFDAANLSHFDISVLIDRVMASLGFYLEDIVEHMEDNVANDSQFEAKAIAVEQALSHTTMPTAAYGWPICSADWWPQRKLIDPSQDVRWDSEAWFGGSHCCDVRTFRLFDDLVRQDFKCYLPNDPENPDAQPKEDRKRSPRMWPLHCFFFGKGLAAWDDQSTKPGWLFLNTNVSLDYAERSVLDRYWVLVLTDAVLQIHSALKCEEAEFYLNTDSPPLFSVGKTVAPNFWPAGFYEFEPSGDPRVDAILDAYEQELRDDPLRKMVLSQEFPLPESLQ